MAYKYKKHIFKKTERFYYESLCGDKVWKIRGCENPFINGEEIENLPSFPESVCGVCLRMWNGADVGKK